MGLGGSLDTDDAVHSCLEKNTASSPATKKITSKVKNMSCQRRMVAPKQFQMKLWNLKLQHAIPFQQEIVRALFLLCKFRSWVQNTWKCLNKSWQTWKTRASGLFTSLLALNIPSTVFKIMIHLIIYHTIYYIEHLQFSRSIYHTNLSYMDGLSPCFVHLRLWTPEGPRSGSWRWTAGSRNHETAQVLRPWKKRLQPLGWLEGGWVVGWLGGCGWGKLLVWFGGGMTKSWNKQMTWLDFLCNELSGICARSMGEIIARNFMTYTSFTCKQSYIYCQSLNTRRAFKQPCDSEHL